MRIGVVISFVFFVLSVAQGQNTLIVKLKPAYSSLFSNGEPAQLQSTWNRYQLPLPVQKFPKSNEDEAAILLGLERIYELSLKPNKSYHKLEYALNRSGFFEYVEYKQKGELAFTPNDPQFPQQNYLQAIGAAQAWDSTQGSASVIVALLDAGIDTSHEDLKGKYVVNSSDPRNGIDDDNDGFTDNYLGWNFNTNNDNVIYSTSTHGVQMAGAIAPQTHNSKGIAGVGFGVKILPVNVVNGNNQVVFGYEGIKYAADKGCSVINCSWNIKNYSSFGHDMVKYATAKGALVVAAMGNNSTEDENYPAMYPEVMGVGGVDNNGYKVSNSNYGYKTDISAPGLQVLTTRENNRYVRNSGTSLATAIVSGSAALLRSFKPGLSAEECKSFLKASARNIYQGGQNAQYVGKLGTGMLHIGDAITYDGRAFVELVSYQTHPSSVKSGDSVKISVELKNELQNSGIITAVLMSENAHSSVLNTTSTWTGISKGQKVNNQGQEFMVKVNNNAPNHFSLDFSLLVIHGSDTTHYGLNFLVNQAYVSFNTGKIKSALGTRGTYGWYLYPQKEGKGVVYKNGSQLLYEGGFMVGQKSTGMVADRVRGIRNVEQSDFEATDFLVTVNEPLAPYALQGAFHDSLSPFNEIGLNIQQKLYAFPGESTRDQFFVLEYTLKSKYGYTLPELYMGMVSDWDIEDFEKNRAGYVHEKHLAFTYSTENKGPYCGMQVLTLANNRSCYSIDHIIGGAGGIDLTDNDVFSKAEKLTALSTSRNFAGAQSGGNDVLQVLATGPYTLNAGDSLVFRVAILLADDLPQLRNLSDTAYALFGSEETIGIREWDIPSLKIYPNPASEEVHVTFSSPMSGEVKLLSSDGQVLHIQKVVKEESVVLDVSTLSSGFYVLQMGEFSRVLMVE
jgi:subtilisin family serine protease